MIDLKEVITKYPESLESAARFRAYMADLYPDNADHARIKVLADVISCGIVDEIKAGNTDSLSISRYRKLMEDRYGYSGRLIAESIAKWVQAYAPSDAPAAPTAQKSAPSPVIFDNEAIHVHHYEDIVIPATCRERGYTLHRCKCGYERKDSFTPLGLHQFEVVDEIKPTCTEEGRKDLLCAVCSEYKSEVLPKVAHVFSPWKTVREAGCEATGEKKCQCSSCAKTETGSIPALGHDWSNWENSFVPTCTETGKQVRQCSRCKKIEEQELPAAGHKFTDWQPSQAQEGMMERYCKNCGKVEQNEVGAWKQEEFRNKEKIVEDNLIQAKEELRQLKQKESKDIDARKYRRSNIFGWILKVAIATMIASLFIYGIIDNVYEPSIFLTIVSVVSSTISLIGMTVIFIVPKSKIEKYMPITTYQRREQKKKVKELKWLLREMRNGSEEEEKV